MTQWLHEAVADVLILTAQNELSDFLDTGDRSLLPRIAREYLAVCRNREVYDQLRYLDERGREVVRVNFNAGQPAVVPDTALQDKRGRYYFTDAMALDAGGVYVSPLDLNIENGAIEIPYKSMIRIGAPVFDARGRKRGVVLVNFLAQTMLDAVAKAGLASPGDPMLLNGEGYWLLSPNPPPSWGFMFPGQEEIRMQSFSPPAWAAMNQAPSGQVNTEAGLFTFRVVHPLAELERSVGEAVAGGDAAAAYRWFVISHVARARIDRSRTEILARLSLVGAILLILIAVGVRAVSVVRLERQRHHDRLERMARVDALTGIANRAAFEDRLDEEFERSRRHDRRFALLYLDLDGFKAINDTQGHQAGDRVLRDVADTLTSNCRSVDLAARFGGDEFVLLLSELPEIAQAKAIAEKVRERIVALRWNGRAVSASIGIAGFPDHADSLPELIRLADAAMYSSKKAGKNRVTLAAKPLGQVLQSSIEVS